MLEIFKDTAKRRGIITRKAGFQHGEKAIWEISSERMIYPYDNATQTRWDRGEFQVQLNLHNNPRPMGFCDGSPEDVAELHAIAEAEGADDVKVHKKYLKSGREVWTLGG